MRNSSEDAWFYTHKGGQHGPVSLRDLKNLAESGGLDPRYDMCWSHGMADWRPAGEIEGVFKKRAATDAPRPPGIAATLAGNGAASQTVNGRGREPEMERLLREADWPGVSRVGYLFAIWVLPVLLTVGFALVTPFLLTSEDLVNQTMINRVTTGGLVMFGVFAVVVSLQRLTNLGMSRWWFLGHWLPLINLWVAYRSICCPPGYAYHGKLDGMGMLMAIVYWGLILLILITFLAAVAASQGLLAGGVFDDLLQMIEVYSLDQVGPGEIPPPPSE